MPGTLNVKTLRLAPLGHSRKRADQMGDNWRRDESGKKGREGDWMLHILVGQEPLLREWPSEGFKQKILLADSELNLLGAARA